MNNRMEMWQRERELKEAKKASESRIWLAEYMNRNFNSNIDIEKVRWKITGWIYFLKLSLITNYKGWIYDR